MENIELTLLLALCTILILIIVGYVAYILVNRYLVIHKRLALYGDIKKSVETKRIHLILDNVENKPELWNAHEDDLTLVSMGSTIPAAFVRASDGTKRYEIVYGEKLSHLEILSLVGGVKYNKMFISNDGGETLFHANSVSDKTAKSIYGKNNEITDHTKELRKEILSEIKESDKFFYVNHEFDNDEVISHIHEGKTTSHTMRYQAIISDDNEVFDMGFTPETIKFYHVYDGYCYEMESKFIGKFDHLYEWDLINLHEFSAYVGFSFSIDGGKTILPSTSLYGVTRDEDGILPVVAEANLAKPKPGVKPHKMWNEKQAIEYIGKELTEKTYNIIVKKHYEEEHTDVFIPLHTIKQFYQDITWLKLGKDLKED